MFITTKDPIHTWAEVKPTHNVKPVWIARSRKAVDAAWTRHLDLCDLFEEGKATREQVQDALAQAVAAQDMHAELCAMYQRGEDPDTLRLEAAARLIEVRYE